MPYVFPFNISKLTLEIRNTYAYSIPGDKPWLAWAPPSPWLTSQCDRILAKRDAWWHVETETQNGFNRFAFDVPIAPDDFPKLQPPFWHDLNISIHSQESPC